MSDQVVRQNLGSPAMRRHNRMYTWFKIALGLPSKVDQMCALNVSLEITRDHPRLIRLLMWILFWPNTRIDIGPKEFIAALARRLASGTKWFEESMIEPRCLY